MVIGSTHVIFHSNKLVGVVQGKKSEELAFYSLLKHNQSSSIEPLLQITCGDPPKACLIVSMPSLSAYSLPFETCIPPLDNISGNPFNPNLRQRKDKVP